MTAERKAEQTSDVFAMCPMCGVSTCIPATDDEKRAAGLLPPLPTESEPEREDIRDSQIANEWESRPSDVNDAASLEREFAARLSPAPETPSPEVGMREEAHRLLDAWLDSDGTMAWNPVQRAACDARDAILAAAKETK